MTRFSWKSAAVLLTLLAWTTAARAGVLLVSNFGPDDVKRFDAATGAFLDTFVGGPPLVGPSGLAFGPDGHLYVAITSPDQVLRYNGTTGAFLGAFTSGGGLSNPGGVAFGPDGHLYVASAATADVQKFDGATGAFLASFSNNTRGATDVAFGPDGNLYVATTGGRRIEKFDPVTGAFLGDILPPSEEGFAAWRSAPTATSTPRRSSPPRSTSTTPLRGPSSACSPREGGSAAPEACASGRTATSTSLMRTAMW